jgi:hypothetical protein
MNFLVLLNIYIDNVGSSEVVFKKLEQLSLLIRNINHNRALDQIFVRDQTVNSAMAYSAQHWFRISGIPTGWTDVGVLGALTSLEPPIIHEDRHPRLSVYPACAGSTLTGLLKLENCSELLEKVKSGIIHLELSLEGEKAVVDLDRNFYNLTPLNTLGNEHIAEYIPSRLPTHTH